MKDAAHMPTSARDAAGRVLVVDDLASNRELLVACLGAAGHEVRPCASAEEAEGQLSTWSPDCILLDVMMPRIDGLQYCRRLKQQPQTMAIPVLLVTSLSDRAIRIRAVEAGADEFLSKPLDPHEVTLRVRNAIRSKRLYDDSRRAHQELQQLEEMREQLVHMVVHDLRSPLFGIRLSLESLLLEPEQLPLEVREDIDRVYGLSATLVEMVSSILDVHRMEAGKMPFQPEACALDAVVAEAITHLVGHRQARPVRIEAQPTPVRCDGSLMRRAVGNLVANAIRHSPAHSDILVRCGPDGGGALIEVSDHGPGIPADQHARIFQKFGSLDPGAKASSTGLGLPFCKMVMDLHHGEIGVRSVPGQGSTFWMRLPG